MEFVERIGKQFSSALLGHAIQKRRTARLKHCVVDPLFFQVIKQ